MSLRVCQIGAGYFAGFHSEAWQRLQGCELVGICDLDEGAARRLAGNAQVFQDAASMLDHLRPDLIDIATPPATHAQMIDLAIERGIPAICQKPLAPTFQEALSIAERVRQSDHLVVVHENFRFQPWYREAKKLLNAGFLGSPYSITFRLRPGDGQGNDAYLARQPYFQKMPRFLIHETGVHWIDTFRFLLGDVHQVSASLRRLNPRIAGEDAGIVQFTFQCGATGLFDGNRLARHPARNPRLTMGEMWLEGSDTTLRLDGDGKLWQTGSNGQEIEHVYDWMDKGFGGDCVARLQQHVLQHLILGTAVENTIGDYMRNLEIVEAIYLSASKRSIIDMENER